MTVLVLLSVLFLVFTNAANLEDQLPHLGDDSIDVQLYDLTLKVDELGQDIQAKAQITVTLNSWSRYVRFHVETSRYEVKRVSLQIHNWEYPLGFEMITGNDTISTPNLSGDVLKICLPFIYKGFTAKINVEYTLLSDAFQWGSGIGFNSNFSNVELLNVVSWPYYTRYWLPSHDHPNDVASFRYTFKIPSNVNVATANGIEVKNKVKGGKKVVVYEQENLIPTYATNFVLAKGDIETESYLVCYDDSYVNQEQIDCTDAPNQVEIQYSVPKDDPSYQEFVDTILASSEVLIFYSSTLGSYAFEKLGFVVAPHPFNMESVNLITLVEPWATNHEVLHMWWGNSIYFNHWGDFWISEGLTTYFTAFYDEITYGITDLFDWCPVDPDAILNNPKETDPLDIFDYTPYCKGAASIHGIRQRSAEVLGLELYTAPEQDFFIRTWSTFYQLFFNQQIDTFGIVEYFRSNLVTIFEAEGTTVTQAEVDTLIDAWFDDWFVEEAAGAGGLHANSAGSLVPALVLFAAFLFF